jgi:hypothetical protein
MSQDIDPTAYDNWLARDYEYPHEPVMEECHVCEGNGLAWDPGGNYQIDEPCEFCDDGKVEVTEEELRDRARAHEEDTR